jgi:hypothetical protein
MITPEAASFVNARPFDHHQLHKIGLSATMYSSETLTGSKWEYVAFNHVNNGFEGGVREVVVHFYTETEQTLTAELAPEVLHAAQPRRDEMCHYIISAEAYSPDFAQAFDGLTREKDMVTLIDRSIREAWTTNRAALHRLTIAQHALADSHPSDLALHLFETPDPDETDAVAVHFSNLIYQVCAMVEDYHGDLDLAEGIEQSWGAVVSDYHREGQVRMALLALDIAVGAIEGTFEDLGVDKAVIDRTLVALSAAADVIDPERQE